MAGLSGLGRNLGKGGNSSSELYLQLALTRLLEEVSKDSTSTETKGVLMQMLSVLQQDKEVEVCMVRCTHSDETVDILREVTDFKASPVVSHYYRADGSEYTLAGDDTLEYIDNRGLLLEIINKLDNMDVSYELVSDYVSSSGTLPVNYGGSVYNAGSEDGVFNGVSIIPGMTISWDGGEFSDVTFDGTGTSLLICYKIKA